MIDISNIKSILVTGGSGFIGSNFLNKYVLEYPNINFINLDVLTYAANVKNLESIENAQNYEFVKGDICNTSLLEKLFEKHNFDAIIHFAAESSVEFSFSDPSRFVQVNVMGTQNLLELAKKYNIKRFHHVSTDEVYGELGDTGSFTEETPLAPNSPYSASKAGSDMMVRSYVQTFGLNATISRCSNNYGPHQDHSKFIPKFITHFAHNKKAPLHGDGKNVRDWLFVEDHIDAIWTIFLKADSGSVYNIGGNNEKTNLDVAQSLLEKMELDNSYIEFVSDRLQNDFRYSIDASKIKKDLGWEPRHNFDLAIVKTIEFYVKSSQNPFINIDKILDLKKNLELLSSLSPVNS